jgi:hypothetical protein
VRPNASVQRKCLHCNHLYDEAEMLFGVKRCPICWWAEDFVYVDRHGEEVNYESGRTRAKIDYDIRVIYQDTGCQYHSLCQSCPFEVCLEDLPYAERMEIIAKSRQEVIEKRNKPFEALMMYDRGMSPEHIAEVLGAKQTTVSFWLSKRRKFEARMQKVTA